MINYENARKSVRRVYNVKNGYNDSNEICGLSFQDGIAVEVWKKGAHRANGHKYESEAEMIYYFDNHRETHFPQSTGGNRLLNVLSWLDGKE